MAVIFLDSKESCKGYYTLGNLHFNEKAIPNNLVRTWKYLPYLDGKNIDFVYFFCQGNDLESLCPTDLKADWQLANKKLTAFLNSFKIGKVDLKDNCVYDLIPKQFLLEFCELKSKIIDSIAETHKKPITYDFHVDLERMLTKIRDRQLKIDLTSLHNIRYKSNVRSFLTNIEKYSKNIDYDQFGSKTGRLTTRKMTFPILNLNSDYRCILKPQNDLFVEIDYSAAEPRTLLCLSEQEQPKEDLHDWNAKRLNMSREQSKKELLAWLYGSSQVDGKKFENLYQTQKVLEKYYDGRIVKNPFGREIESDDFHALSHLCQSTSSDNVLRQAIKVDNFLKDKKSFITGIIHDSLLLDCHRSELGICDKIVSIFSNSQLGVFPVRTSSGKSWGSLV